MKFEDITSSQRQLLAHTLGATDRIMKKDWGYRNYFSTEEWCDDLKELRDLVKKGYMVERKKFGELVFSATRKGALAVGFKNYQLAGKRFPAPSIKN